MVLRHACGRARGSPGAADRHHSGCSEEKSSTALLPGLSWHGGDLPAGCGGEDDHRDNGETVQSSSQVN